MSRIKPVDYDSLQAGKSKEMLDQIKSKLGKIPNIFKYMAVSPAVLGSYMGFSGALAQASISPKVREQIALAVAQENSCDYCLAAHTVMAKGAGLSDTQIADSRKFTADDTKTGAIIKFAQKLSKDRANVTDMDVKRVREAGLSDAEIIEVVAVVSLNIFTNYFNHVVDPEIDFPKV